MEKSKVSLIYCDSYDEEQVYEAVKTGVDLIGGISQFAERNEKILVKPNLLKGALPEKAITTHPSVFGAVLRLLRENGYENIKYGDSAGMNANKMADVAEISKLPQTAAKYGVPQALFDEGCTVEYPQGRYAKKFVLAKDVTEADAIISVSKMKTHALENITGALKNQYGCIYAANKAVGHAKYPNSRIFADMLADLNAYLKPRLFIMDGILAMEGNGPGSGDPKKMNVLLMSKDPVALDTVFSHLVWLDPSYVPTTVSAAKAGLGTMSSESISVLTPQGEISISEAKEKYGDPSFNVVRKKPHFWKFDGLFEMFFGRSERPVLDPDKCIACGICQEACPAEGKAVHSGDGQKAVFDYKKCIRCFCCQEMCPAKAISRKEK